MKPGLGFIGGMRFFFRGFSLLARTPGAIPLALVPVFVAIAITVVLWMLAVFFIPSLVEWWTGSEGWWASVVKVLATITCLALSVLLGIAFAQPASGPALDALVRRVEKQIGLTPHPEAPFHVEVARSAGSAVLGLGVAAVAFVVLLLLGLIPGAVVVTVPLNIVTTAFCIGWDLCDYPLSARGIPLAERVKLVFGNWRAVLGFSLGLALCSLIPCGFLLFFPVGIAGATEMVTKLQPPPDDGG